MWCGCGCGCIAVCVCGGGGAPCVRIRLGRIVARARSDDRAPLQDPSETDLRSRHVVRRCDGLDCRVCEGASSHRTKRLVLDAVSLAVVYRVHVPAFHAHLALVDGRNRWGKSLELIAKVV
jgi:hypothetical protein